MKIIFIGIFLSIFLLGYFVRYVEHYSEDNLGNKKIVYKGLELQWGDVEDRILPFKSDPELVYHRTEKFFFGTYEVGATGGKGYMSSKQAMEVMDKAMGKSPSIIIESTKETEQ